MGTRVFCDREGRHEYKEKINFERPYLNWSYHCKFMVYNTSEYRNKCRGIHTHTHNTHTSQLCPLLRSGGFNTTTAVSTLALISCFLYAALLKEMDDSRAETEGVQAEPKTFLLF